MPLSMLILCALIGGLGQTAPASNGPPDWSKAEGVLKDQMQLTFGDRFVKAGEAYFNPDSTRIVFQAIERDSKGDPESEYYSMYVAQLVDEGPGRTDQSNQPRFRLERIRKVSPAGSSNTCGWFHPTDANKLIFASTITPPAKREAPGYQRGSRNYRWSFPPEMRVVELDLGAKDITPESLKGIVGDAQAYTAECSTSPDGRTLLYTSLESGDGDLYAMDLPTRKITRLTSLAGYDGGGFFSPDGKSLIWRADRNGDNVLQIFLAEVQFDAKGSVIGIGEPIAVTNDGAVNWAPFFSPNGKWIVYASSRVGHDNYEVLAVEVPTDRSAPLGQPRRVTSAPGADLLPAISHDGTKLMWTSQRGGDRTSQLWLATMDQDDLQRAGKAPNTSESSTHPGASATARPTASPDASQTNKQSK